MIDILRRFFDKANRNVSERPEEERSHDIQIATCALLLEMANIDDEFSQSEREGIISTLKENYHLSDDHAEQLIEITKKELEGSVDLWRFTNFINQNYSLMEKTRIIEMVWKIAYADGRLHEHEDYLIHKLANLLRLNHEQLIEAKLRVLHKNSPQ
jgi:uncharacterized tellurite resistance protein B-like protein